MSDNIDRCHIIVLMYYLQAGWTHRERCKFFFENKNVQTILKHSFPYLMFILCWDVIFMMFILKIKLILEDFEDGSDQVEHNHKKVLLLRLCICPNFAWCICSNLQMYLSKLQNVFVQIDKCICPNCQMYLLKLTNVFDIFPDIQAEQGWEVAQKSSWWT